MGTPASSSRADPFRTPLAPMYHGVRSDGESITDEARVLADHLQQLASAASVIALAKNRPPPEKSDAASGTDLTGAELQEWQLAGSQLMHSETDIQRLRAHI